MARRDERGKKTLPNTHAKRRILSKDDRGRPTEVLFSGDPASQCPACLSKDVFTWGGVGFVPTGNRWRDDDFSPISRMKCRTCGAHWTRPGL